MKTPKKSTERDAGSSPEGAKHVYIVDDHPVFREGLIQILDRDTGLKFCGEAGDAETALEAIRRLKPDVVVVDLSLPGKSGLDLIKEVRAENKAIKLLVVSMHDEALYADRVLRAGGDGYIMKQEDPEEILTAIQDVLAGRIYVSEEVLAGPGKAKAVEPARPLGGGSKLGELTDAELVVLEALGQGKSNEEIALEIGLSPGAVASHCKEMARKLNLKTANALVRYAVCWVEQGRT